MRSRRILLVGALMLLLGPATALTQVGQQGGGRGGRGGGGGLQGGGGGGFGGGGGMMNLDPAERWNQMTGGKDVWARAEVADPNQQRIFDWMARSLNITNGQITRQQFIDGSAQMRQRFQQGGFGRGGGIGGGPGGPGGAPQGGAAGPGGAQGGAGVFNPDAMVEIMFRRYDRNGDGVLNNDELPDNLKAERDKWDANKDGLIDLAEFKEYMKGRMDQIRAEMSAAAGAPSAGGATGALPMLPTGPITPEEEPKKVVVYRAGKLPKELPPWFTQYDKDGDGQIGLYEWKTTGLPLKQFTDMDRNGDGFVTVEEVLRYEAEQNKARGGNGTMVAGTMPGGFRGSGGNFSGPPPGGNFSGPQGNAGPGNARGDFRQRGQGRQGGGQDSGGGGRRGGRQGGGGPG